MNVYPLGSALVLVVTFEISSTSTPGDPGVVTLRVLNPAGTETVYTGAQISHPSTGRYQKIIEPDIPGVWTYRWKGTSGITAAQEQKFEMRPSSFNTP